MTPAEVSRAFFDELWNKRNLAYADRIIANDCVTRQLRSGSDAAVPRGPNEIKAHITDWLSGFPDMHALVQHSAASGEDVFTWVVMEGTHEAEWHGIAATGRQVTIQCMVMHRVRGGKIVEDWVLVDSAGFYKQLGIASFV